ncbi:MAG: cyclic pyranopterin monophosphate synthase MoaC [Dehalococcoidia bacterium]|nr:cyclic pyranopterin monophosphate synthase MoaC [Dehalococcoidia bacterium]
MSGKQIRMIDVTPKEETERIATAKGKISMKAETRGLILRGEVIKGDVLALSQVAGIMAAKETPHLIPLCHPVLLTNVTVDFDVPEGSNYIGITATAKGVGKTGFEMEALVAVAASALNIYDMCKGVDRGMVIEEIHLAGKSGGKSGVYLAEERE